MSTHSSQRPPTQLPPPPVHHRGVLLRYTAAATLGRVADGGAATALVLFALDRTGGAAAGGVLAAATTLPHLVAAPAVGLLSDRVRSVRLLYVSTFLIFAVGLLGVLAGLGRTPFVVPVVCALVAGSAGPLLSGGMTSLLGELVPAEMLPRAFAIDSGTYSAAGIAGPAMVAAVAGLVSPGAGLASAAAVAFLAAVALCFVPVTDRRTSPSGRVTPRQFLAGGVALWRSLPLRASTVATTVSFVGVAGVLPVAVAVFAVQLGHPASAGGALLSAFAVGALVGSLVVSARPPNLPGAGRTIMLSVLATGILLVGAALSPSFAVALVLFVMAGVADAPMLTATFLVRNDSAPVALRTQVFTTAAGLKIGSSALGSLAAGVTASTLGGSGLLLAAAAVQGMAVALGFATGRRPRSSDCPIV